MEPDAKSIVDHQRRLNPKMKEVVRTEILKLLEAGIIYPIADSRWLSHVHRGGREQLPWAQIRRRSSLCGYQRRS